MSTSDCWCESLTAQENYTKYRSSKVNQKFGLQVMGLQQKFKVQPRFFSPNKADQPDCLTAHVFLALSDLFLAMLQGSQILAAEYKVTTERKFTNDIQVAMIF